MAVASQVSEGDHVPLYPHYSSSGSVSRVSASICFGTHPEDPTLVPKGARAGSE